MKVTVQNAALDDETELVLERSEKPSYVYLKIAFDDGSGSTILVKASDLASATKAFME